MLLSSLWSKSLAAYVRGANCAYALRKTATNNLGFSIVLMGLALTLLPLGVDAQTISGTLDGLNQTLRDIVNFAMNAAVVIGVLAILYGVKLVIDKSNERENVKTGHIVFAFVGGALMCMLWFVVRMMTNTIGDGDIGEEASW